jgi:broad specificity phosphatase PhoE
MELFLCRHGETEHNDNGIVQGQMNTKINGKGKQQAKKLRDRLAEENIDKVYSSSMTRAVETAEIVAEPHDIEIEETEELKEVARAKFEGERFEDLIEEIIKSETEDYLWKPEGGESLEELKERGADFLNTIKEEHEGEQVVAISHRGTISSTLLGILGHSSKNSYRINQENCSINKLTWKTYTGWSIHSVNDSSHL